MLRRLDWPTGRFFSLLVISVRSQAVPLWSGLQLCEGVSVRLKCLDVTRRNAVSRHTVPPGEPVCPESTCGIFTYIFIHLGWIRDLKAKLNKEFGNRISSIPMRLVGAVNCNWIILDFSVRIVNCWSGEMVHGVKVPGTKSNLSSILGVTWWKEKT